jgi:hypothetical protein
VHRIIAIEVGKDPEIRMVERIDLSFMQRFVGGYIEHLSIAWTEREAIDLWFNENGRLSGMPLNRMVIDEEGAVWDILGPMFITSSDEEGETVGLSEEAANTWLERARSWATTY